MTRIGVLVFPGTNCMHETRAALVAAGAEAVFLDWRTRRDTCGEFDGFVLPGGFSYEDRVRAGAIAAKHEVVDGIAEAAARGRPVLGICNGAQVLVEAGLVPGLEPGRVSIALGRNADRRWHGYLCEWISVTAPAPRGILQTAAERGLVLPMPVGHGEGRFLGDADAFADLADRGQIALQYVGAEGHAAAGFPDNPNASLHAAAGISDASGRVLAMMPHPERAAWLFQVPDSLPGPWGEARRAARRFEELRGRGPGQVLYDGFVQAARETVVQKA